MTDAKQVVPWEPQWVLTEEQAHRLTMFLKIKAKRDIERERLTGKAEYPDPKAKHLDSKQDKENRMAYAACVAERAYRYVENWIGAGEASRFEIMAWIEEKDLYKYHPRAWATLEQMLEDIADQSRSQSGRSVYSRLASRVMPFLREHRVADPMDVMTAIMEPEAGKSKLYHATPQLEACKLQNDPQTAKAIMDDVLDRSVTKDQFFARWKSPGVPASYAELRKDGQNRWQLRIDMNDRQREMILRRLGHRITFERKEMGG